MSRVKPIHLGFEVGTGQPIAVPLKHTVVSGQTQESGKTTTLEALISRSGLRAVAFVTKRGETSFVDAPRVPPYFRERADWQFVLAGDEGQPGGAVMRRPAMAVVIDCQGCNCDHCGRSWADDFFSDWAQSMRGRRRKLPSIDLLDCGCVVCRQCLKRPRPCPRRKRRRP